MKMTEWAKREVEIACEKEGYSKRKEDEWEWDYGRACYESALRAFENLCEEGHSRFSIKLTQNILNRLIDGQPLTPIEDTDDVWLDGFRYKYVTAYQCKRMGSFFKDVYDDGSVVYTDNNRCYCIDIHDPNNTYYSSIVRKIINEMFPITMPYMPGKPIKVYCEEFLTDKKNGDFDTVGVFYALKTENGKQEKIEINRFFREPEGDENGTWTEISKEEYDKQKEDK